MEDMLLTYLRREKNGNDCAVIATVMPEAFPLFSVRRGAKSEIHKSNCRQVQNMQLHALARIKKVFFFFKGEWMIV